jgi:hypothetical protein
MPARLFDGILLVYVIVNTFPGVLEEFANRPPVPRPVRAIRGDTHGPGQSAGPRVQDRIEIFIGARPIPRLLGILINNCNQSAIHALPLCTPVTLGTMDSRQEIVGQYEAGRRACLGGYPM